MRSIYNLGIRIYFIIAWCFSFFNQKAKSFVDGRKNVFSQIANKINANEKHIWFHFASLGEFEQGRPVLEKIKAIYPSKKIVITFFSPSGYEIRKNYALAEGIFYLPIDTRQNATKFIRAIHPEIVIFTKYEFWYHYFKIIKKNNIPLYIISGIFRPNQVFFKWYGGFYINILKNVTHFFLQNEESMQLLHHIGFNNCSISGDTRFDRVAENALNAPKFEKIKQFCSDKSVFIAGSTWLADEELIASLRIEKPNWKFIIAPHEINEPHLQQINKLFPDAVRYSALTEQHADANTLIIDNIGMLSSIYQYGKIAYIGGGFGNGIHNTLEAAAFGMPIIFGQRYHKFQEAKDLIAIGAAKSIHNSAELVKAFDDFNHQPDAGALAKNYVLSKKGATDIIVNNIPF